MNYIVKRVSNYIYIGLDKIFNLENDNISNIEKVKLTAKQKIIELSNKLNKKQSIKVYNYMLGILDAKK